MSPEEEQRIRSNVRQNLKDHEFTKAIGSASYEIWTGRNKSGSSVWAFELIFTPFAIYAGGDIPTLVFAVGRGLEFLAGKDLFYYIHSKLEAEYRDRTEVSPDGVRRALCCILRHYLDGEFAKAADADMVSESELDAIENNDLDTTIEVMERLGLPAAAVNESDKDGAEDVLAACRILEATSFTVEDHELVDALSRLAGRYPYLWEQYGSTMYRTHSSIEWALVVYNEIARMILESTGRSEDSSRA